MIDEYSFYNVIDVYTLNNMIIVYILYNTSIYRILLCTSPDHSRKCSHLQDPLPGGLLLSQQYRVWLEILSRRDLQ